MIKRFNPDFSLSISHELAYMRETPEGGYVAHGDYATLFSELELVKAERDRFQQINEQTLQVKLQMAETIKEQSDRVNALAVRNEQLMAFVTEGFNITGQGGTWCGGDLQELGEKLGLFARETYQPVLHGYICGHEPGEDSVYVITKSPTDAALAAIEARGVEKFIVWATASSGFDYDLTIEDAQKFAAELREAK